MKFAKVRLACLGCKAPLDPGATDLCAHCRPKARAPATHAHSPITQLDTLLLPLDQSSMCKWTVLEYCTPPGSCVHSLQLCRTAF